VRGSPIRGRPPAGSDACSVAPLPGRGRQLAVHIWLSTLRELNHPPPPCPKCTPRQVSSNVCAPNSPFPHSPPMHTLQATAASTCSARPAPCARCVLRMTVPRPPGCVPWCACLAAACLQAPTNHACLAAAGLQAPTNHACLAAAGLQAPTNHACLAAALPQKNKTQAAAGSPCTCPPPVLPCHPAIRCCCPITPAVWCLPNAWPRVALKGTCLWAP